MAVEIHLNICIMVVAKVPLFKEPVPFWQIAFEVLFPVFHTVDPFQGEGPLQKALPRHECVQMA
jgi:hypothetical protein